jgi:Flp pilus assembly protein CpaB
MAARVATSVFRRRTSPGLTLGVGAIVVGVGLMAYTIGARTAPTPSRESHKAFVPEFDVVDVPVPERPVPPGTAVRDIRTRLEKFPLHQLPHGALRDLAAVRDQVTLVPLPGGLPVMEANLGNVDEVSNPLVGRIPPGMRAMTVRVDATSAVEGWARSGSIVDVLLVEKTRTTVIAEQVKVISAERSLSPVDAGQSAGAVPNTVTLLVSQEQCLAINTAVPLGKIAFALRSQKDLEGWRETRLSSDDIRGGAKEPERERIGGVVTFGVGAERRQLALVDGRWIPADTVPTGFFERDSSRSEEKR